MRKGQAALEFLTTYGWAFLVILVMIGALAYFGVLNPKNFLPSRCTFSPEIDCLEARMDAPPLNLMQFRFRNNVGSTADFNASAVYVGPTLAPNSTCFNSSGGFSINLAPGRAGEFRCFFSAAQPLPKDDKAKFEVTVIFKKSDGSFWNPAKGEIYGTVN